jgi:riboflavin kinase/FMN adenylyltransferase
MNLPFTIKGVVTKNVGRGKKLGFPTANIAAPDNIKDGIYLGYTVFDGKRYPSLCFVGAAVTFNETQRFAESYILDFHGDLYGKTIALELEQFIRESRKFDSPQEMQRQIKEDERIARVFFASNRGNIQ